METKEDKTADAPPVELDGYPLEVRDVVFRTLDKKIVLRMSVTRSLYRGERKNEWVANCGLYLYVGWNNKQNSTYEGVPVNVDHWFSSRDYNLERIDLVCHDKALRLRLPHADVENIAPDERERLLEFLKQVRGVQLNYTADLFGFLRKDGSDKTVVTELPFPVRSMPS